MPDVVGHLRAPVLSPAPSNPVAGQMYYDSASNTLFFWNGTQWVSTASTSGTIYDCDQVGTIKTFAGTTIPSNWALCDGRLLSRASYPDLFNAIGVTWGAGDGSTTFAIPDLRSRMLVCAGAGAGLTSRAAGAYGGGTLDANSPPLGEETHVLANAEMPVHAHGGATGGGTTGGMDRANPHGHSEQAWSTSNFAYTNGGGIVWSYGGSSTSAVVPRNGGAQDWAQYNMSHSHTINATDINHLHSVPALGIGNDGGGGAHNNMPPWCAVAYIIKVTGMQINAGGALVGATGQRGAIWYNYTGTGTPPTGNFVGELDGDWCIRKSDGENFQRVSGAWVDQGFTNRTTATVTSARAYRAAALSPAAGWVKIPLDTLSYDVSSNLWQAANNRFVCPLAGYYQVSGQVQSSAAPSIRGIVAIWKNGAEISRGADMTFGGYFGLNVADVIQCNAGDYLELYLYASASPGALDVTNVGTHMAVALITSGPGPQGARGSSWYTYTGSGTPAVGAVNPNETVYDLAFRASDGEVFQRQSSAWVDQNVKLATGLQAMDTWHVMGTSDPIVPPFQNGWVNYAAPYGPVAFRKFPDGKVKMKGLTNGGSPVAGTILVLPLGYRPAHDCIFSGPNNGAIADLRVNTDGTVLYSSVLAGVANSGWLSLDVIEFDTELVTQLATGAQGPPGSGATPFTVQRNSGKYAGYNTFSASNTTILDGAGGTGAGNALTLSVTPTVNSWWEINFNCANVYAQTAAYYYTQLQMNMSPADQDGLTSSDGAVIMQHSQVQTYEGRTFQRIFRLAAGQTYTITPVWQISGGTFQYYTAPTHLWIEGKLWPQ